MQRKYFSEKGIPSTVFEPNGSILSFFDGPRLAALLFGLELDITLGIESVDLRFCFVPSFIQPTTECAYQFAICIKVSFEYAL